MKPYMQKLVAAMTIRDLLTRQSRRNLLVGFLAWLAFAGSLFVGAKSGHPFLPLVFFVPFIGAVLVQVFFVRCPRCKGNLGLLLAQTMSPLTLTSKVSCCPYCGVEFSEEIHP